MPFGIDFGPGWNDGTPEGLANFNAWYAPGGPGAAGKLPTVNPTFGPLPNAAPRSARQAFSGIPTNRASYTSRLALNPLANLNDQQVDFGGLVNNADPCQYIPGEGPIGDAARAACRAVGQRVFGTSSTPLAGTTPPCPQGYHQLPDGSCELDGMAPYIPGDVGRPDVIWTPINGRYGQGARPVAMQATHLACPSGMVLGKDNVCYEHLARTNRKWNPGHKPLLTGGDMNAIRKTKSLEKRWRKVAPAFHKKVVNSGAKLVKRIGKK